MANLLCRCAEPLSIRRPPYLNSLRHASVRHHPHNLSRKYSSSVESLPRVAQPALWHSIVPKFIRKSDEPSSNVKVSKSRKEWNPATFYIVIFLLIGSNAIQMIALRNDFLSFSRKADAKISLLKDVAGRVQKGEDVDVEGLLGTGNEEQEKEWEEVLREIEEEERLWKSKEKRNAKEKVITSDDIKNAIGEATIKRDSAPRHPRAKPPIRLVSTDDNIDDIDGIPPKTMSNDISTQTETEKRRPARFF